MKKRAAQGKTWAAFEIFFEVKTVELQKSSEGLACPEQNLLQGKR